MNPLQGALSVEVSAVKALEASISDVVAANGPKACRLLAMLYLSKLGLVVDGLLYGCVTFASSGYRSEFGSAYCSCGAGG